MSAIYLDYNASTPIDPAVAAVMRELIDGPFGNPSSGHWASAGAKAALDTARVQVAALLRSEADEIVFTSGGSEANNLALKGLFFARGGERAHIVVSAIEHPAVLEPCRFLERLGATVTRVPVDSQGLADPDDVRKAIRPDTRFSRRAAASRAALSAVSSFPRHDRDGGRRDKWRRDRRGPEARDAA